jgi:two-component system, OmpR family, sensor histidine kinase BaeS
MRRRVLLVVSVVLLLAIIAVAVASQFTARVEFDRALRLKSAAEMNAAAAALQRDMHARVDTFETVVVGTDGKIIAANPPSLARNEFHFFPDGLEMRSRRANEMVGLRLKGNAYPIADANGRRVATAYFLPKPGPPQRLLFAGAVRRTLLLVTAAAALVALALTAAMLRRLFRPVEALTEAARAIARGERGPRIPAAGRDEVGELAAAFNGMSEALERNEEARRRMVSDVAHELRTPLTNIRCAVEAAQDGIAPADLASIAEDVGALSRLVDDLQQLSLSDAGQLRLELENVVLADAVAAAVDGMRAQARDLALVVNVDPTLRVRADRARLGQILRNLLGNAIRFARTTVRIEARNGAVAVIDDGPGFPPDDLPRVFDRFYRADASRSRAGGGTGLGLAIVKELVRLHGWTISAENAGGAVVRFTLPFISS